MTIIKASSCLTWSVVVFQFTNKSCIFFFNGLPCLAWRAALLCSVQEGKQSCCICVCSTRLRLRGSNPLKPLPFLPKVAAFSCFSPPLRSVHRRAAEVAPLLLQELRRCFLEFLPLFGGGKAPAFLFCLASLLLRERKKRKRKKKKGAWEGAEMAGLGVPGGVRTSISLETTCGALLHELEVRIPHYASLRNMFSFLQFILVLDLFRLYQGFDVRVLGIDRFFFSFFDSRCFPRYNLFANCVPGRQKEETLMHKCRQFFRVWLRQYTRLVQLGAC